MTHRLAFSERSSRIESLVRRPIVSRRSDSSPEAESLCIGEVYNHLAAPARMNESREPRSPRTARPSAAGRLLVAISRTSACTVEDIARRSRMTTRRLEDCRDGLLSLDPEEQMRLAAAILALAPEYERKAYALYGQAQAALRMREDPGRSHQIYPRDRFL